MMRLLTRRLWLGIAMIGLVLMTAAAPALADDILIFAAASLKNALDDAVKDYQLHGGAPVRVSYAASSALAKQIEGGAPADIFISADLDWMDYVAKKDLIVAGTRSNLLGNKLVLVAPADSEVSVTIAPNFPLAALLKGGRLAMADPAAVPAGKYGKAALEKLGVWDSVQNNIANAEDVRAALRFVSRKEAPLGIVYRSDAAADPGVKIVAPFPDDSYPPVIYPIAALATSHNGDTPKFIQYLHSAAARPFFEKQGFAVLE